MVVIIGREKNTPALIGWSLFHNWIEREWQEFGECRKFEKWCKNGACDNGFKVGYFG